MVTTLKALKRNSYGREFIQEALHSVYDMFKPAHCYIAYFDKMHHKATSLAYYIDGHVSNTIFTYSIDNTLCEKMILSGKPCYFSKNISQIYPFNQIITSQLFQYYLGLPIFSRRGEVIGVIGCLFESSSLFSKDLHGEWCDVLGDILGSDVEYLALLSSQKKLLREMEECQQEAKLGNWQLDLVINCYYWSREIYRIFQCDIDTFVPNNDVINDFIHPDDRVRVSELKDEMINSTNMSYSIIYRIVLSEGDVKYLREHCHILRDINGVATLIKGILQDITDFYHISNKLSQASNKLTMTYNAVAEGIWEYNLETQKLITSPKFWEILSVSKGSVNNINDWLAMVHKDDRLAVIESFSKLRNGDAISIDVEFRLQPKNKHTVCRWFNCKGNIIESNNSNRSDSIVGVLIDITATVLAAQKLTLAKTVFDNTSECIVITDQDNNIISVNKAFETVTGYNHADIIGKNPRILASGYHNLEFYQQMWHSLETTGAWQGQLHNRRSDGVIYPEEMTINKIEDDHNVINYVGVFHDISSRKKTEKKLRLLADNDMLTGLMNRRRFIEKVEKQIAKINNNIEDISSTSVCSLLFIDLDDFKIFNDLYGHDFGDNVLKEVASILRDTVCEHSLICRYGGDEYAVLIKDKDVNYAQNIAAKLVDIISKPIKCNEIEINLTISIGISSYPESGTTHQALLKNADYAMYEQKWLGRNGVCVYDQQLQHEYIRKLKLRDKLKHAIKDKKISVYYQPIIDNKTGTVCKFEALARWYDEHDGFIPPSVFIPIAERYGLIGMLGQQVFEKACADLDRIHRCGFRDVIFSINHSVKEFSQHNQEYIFEIINNYNLPYSAIMIEITESTALDDGKNILEILAAFRERGIAISLDDFGTGYSSLAAIIDIKPDIIKIDRSFIVDIEHSKESQMLVSLVIDLSCKLNVEVVAEGVETQAQLDILSSMSCHYIQGYYYSPAVAIDDAIMILKARNGDISIDNIDTKLLQ
ncbi:GGDEF and EAL domain-containing protein [Photobacterium kishitanii]|uniref:Bifunctional diguanylate cyclase/phosphodiesterase n=2 Tax=Photobacterium kishitanii TaxID=318456 RepID=A0AAX0YS20_9GAMM|nr:GGDEF and EAL domain-containing protein [Photobacterium kishitanii]PSX19531.1 bifunctional diguanylate cyclase/phosphodiesterase [Photobacterium kishitanii]PSX28716.1 bifunctional diguanylate cyclase/phosphodiesterase [Photobacterium kishitanii]PSX32553.1 bifunctional diguanylate cyclase/phosphodiesterase [Photobacterium kishitanii]PSX44307.1 bifunctional diguanylate cyclase/phosphodiesterase [Photobacterium kishitanii]